MYYICIPKIFDYGLTASTFWLRLVMINGHILEISQKFQLREFKALSSAIESFIEKLRTSLKVQTASRVVTTCRVDALQWGNVCI